MEATRKRPRPPESPPQKVYVLPLTETAPPRGDTSELTVFSRFFSVIRQHHLQEPDYFSMYITLLNMGLLLFLIYLLLPRGIRRNLWRPSKLVAPPPPNLNISLPETKAIQGMLDNAERSHQQQRQKVLRQREHERLIHLNETALESNATDQFRNHPSQHHQVPNRSILDETFSRLETRGVRLTAHGIQSRDKRVWVRYDKEMTSICWQTEILSKERSNFVLVRKRWRELPLSNILYVDVGKRTTALLNSKVPSSLCFSLLTNSGSLDLSCHSKLERDAIVSCLSYYLDQVHENDWRILYEETGSSIILSDKKDG